MKYKVGDKVKIREDLTVGEYGGVWFRDEMKHHCGNVVTISYLSFGYPEYYIIKESSFVFSDEMIEGYADLYSYVEKYAMKELKEPITIPIKKIEFSDSIPCGLLDSFKLCEKEKEMKDFNIKNYKVCDNNGIKTVVVEFEDGTKEHAVCCKEDVFELSRGVEVCVLKHIFGSDRYKEIIRESNKQIKAINKAEKKAKKEAEEIKVIIERKKAKAAKRKAKRKERERAERIADMKTAYVAALKECGIEHECNCNCECETN